MKWSPRYFAGYGDDGRPRWSDRESDAAPLYPSDFDVVNQISVSWVEPLGAWVMLYGGDDTDGSATPTPRTHAEPAPGAVHLRWADHPWGALTRDATARVHGPSRFRYCVQPTLPGGSRAARRECPRAAPRATASAPSTSSAPA